MSSKWFDFEDELSQNSDNFELLKKNFGLSTRKTASERKLKSWSSVNKVSDIFDLDTCRTGIFKDKLWNSVIKDRLIGKTKCHEQLHISDTECDELLTDLSESVRRIRNRFSREFDSDLCDRRMRKMRVSDSPSCSSTFSYADNGGDHTWSRKSSCQGNVTFPESSTASVNSDAASEKSFGRSISVNSEESVCTEKSADCSTVCETLPDGTNKTQFENNETWLSKSNSGSVCEKKVKDSTVTEKKEDRVCDKTMKKMSYLERSATGSSLQEESTSERVVSCDKTGTKTVEQKTSSETYKKAYRSPKSSSSIYSEPESCAFRPRPPTFRKSFGETGKTVSEKISKLIDEAVYHDNLFQSFQMPSNLETDIDRMTSDFCEKGSFGREKKGHNRRRLSGLFSEAEKADLDANWSKLNELKTENESLLQENSKLQSIIQDVTAVNKRWQKYNNERRLYVQKLLSTIQDLQEQINLISEKSAFRSSRQEDQSLLYEDIEKLKREFAEHVAVLELQVKSHKDDWEAERKEKQKIVHEKENLEEKVQGLLREVNFLKNLLADERRKLLFCGSCKANVDSAAVFPGNEFFPASASLGPSNPYMPKTFRAAVHVPYNMDDVSSGECFFSDDYLAKKGVSDQRTNYYSTAREAYMSERFSECSKKTSGDTIVVEDENGLRLSITEQFPTKDNLQLKSILKKTDKRLKMMSKTASEQIDSKKSGRSRKSSADERKLTCEECESQSVSIGIEKDGLAKVTSFSPYAIPDSVEYVYPNPEFLRVGTDIRSKSEPNTRSNSSENLKPLRESSSWNNQCPSARGDVCSGCDPSYMPVPPEFLNRYESDRGDRNQF